MDEIRLNNIRKSIPQRDCFSAVLTTNLNIRMIGTPVLVRFPSIPKESLENSPKSLSTIKALEIVNSILKMRSKKDEDPTKNKKTVYGSDFYSLSKPEANLFLQNTNYVMTCISLFNPYIDMGLDQFTISTNGVYFTGVKPLIYDDSCLDLESLDGIDTEIPEYIEEKLINHRYITYTFEDLKESTKQPVIDTIELILGSFCKKYQVQVSVKLQKRRKKLLRNLLNTIAISFYKLEDVIPIFDGRNTKGVFIEICTYSSSNTPEKIYKDGSFDLFKFIFAGSTENILVVDGEMINKGAFVSIDERSNDLYNRIYNEVPQDKIKLEKLKIVSLDKRR